MAVLLKYDCSRFQVTSKVKLEFCVLIIRDWFYVLDSIYFECLRLSGKTEGTEEDKMLKRFQQEQKRKLKNQQFALDDNDVRAVMRTKARDSD